MAGQRMTTIRPVARGTARAAAARSGAHTVNPECRRRKVLGVLGLAVDGEQASGDVLGDGEPLGAERGQEDRYLNRASGRVAGSSGTSMTMVGLNYEGQ